jgi:hypothetical protein
MNGWQKFAAMVEEFVLSVEQSKSDWWWEESAMLKDILSSPSLIFQKCGVKIDYQYPIWDLNVSKLMVDESSIWDANLVLETSNPIVDTKQMRPVCQLVQACELVGNGLVPVYGPISKEKKATIETLGLTEGRALLFDGKTWLYYLQPYNNSDNAKNEALENLRSWKRWAECQDSPLIPIQTNKEKRKTSRKQNGAGKRIENKYQDRIVQLKALKRQFADATLTPDARIIKNAKNWFGRDWTHKPAYGKPKWHEYFNDAEREELVLLKSHFAQKFEFSSAQNRGTKPSRTKNSVTQK